jgi:hypothetical protein
MLGAADNAAIRSAIGLGQTDAPTFLAQSLTGQSLTGTQATSLVDLATTWNTTGNPSLIYGRVTNTNSGTTANLIDLGTFAGGSLFKVDKTGFATCPGVELGVLKVGGWWSASTSASGGIAFGSGHLIAWNNASTVYQTSAVTGDLVLARDAAGILAQRNGTAAQAFRVYNTDPVGGAKEWFEINWQPTGTNSVKIGTALAGGGMARPIDFVTGGVVRMTIAATGKTGIGTATPIAILDVRGANTASEAVSIGGTAANVGNFITLHGSATNGGDVRIYSNYNTTEGALILGTYQNQTTLCILTGGKVGVGSTTAPSKLTVTSGDIEVATIASGLILKSPDGTRYRVTVPNGGTVLTITAV